ncbi:MAG: hypothetical protein NWF14_01115 [Candidatus Bathyarchaeota archaeon]|nr:hypothetical protein [Candidatus Bathyarchaeota archaeon]
MGKFEKDLASLVKKLCEGEDDRVSKEITRLRDQLVSLHKKNLVKINHSVMEIVCAKYLVLAGYDVDLELVLDSLSCDIYARKGFGSLIIEVETGFVPPEHALDPLTYVKARVASKITRYSGYAEKFGLAVPPHYAMQIHPALIEPPRDRREEEIRDVKALCDLYYSNPPVSREEIKNARIHAVYILDIDNGTVDETEPSTYAEKTRPMFY